MLLSTVAHSKFVRPFLFYLAVCANAAEVPASKKDAIKALYQETNKKLTDASTYYRQVRNGHSDDELLDITYLDDVTPRCFKVDGGLLLVLSEEGFRLQQVVNKPLFQLLMSDDASPRQEVPKKSLSEALGVAHRYLALFGIPIGEGLELTQCVFNQTSHSSWEFRWTRTQNGIPWDDNVANFESVWVIFHEEKGLVTIGELIFSPIPKSFDVRVSREDAIVKCAKYVPLVEKTPFYRSTRVGGFNVNGVKSCELKIAIPNWLLDPARAEWIPRKPPQETRLCWVVTYTTVRAEVEKEAKEPNSAPLKLVPPKFAIYLDAGSGHVVGATFQ